MRHGHKQSSFHTSLHWTFDVVETILVGELGLADPTSATPLFGDHQVGLWSPDGTLLVSLREQTQCGYRPQTVTDPKRGRLCHDSAMKIVVTLGLSLLGCWVNSQPAYGDVESPKEPASAELFELLLDEPVETAAGTLVLSSVIEELLLESPTLPESYPAGSGVSVSLILDNTELSLSLMSEGYESATNGWVEDVRVTLVGVHDSEARATVYLEKVSERRLGEPREVRVTRGRPVVMEAPLEMVFRPGIQPRDDQSKVPPGSVTFEFREMYQLDNGQSSGSILDVRSFALDPHKTSWRWRDWEFTLDEHEPTRWMDLTITRYALEPLPRPNRGTESYDLPCSYTARNDAPNLSTKQLDFDWDRYEQCARLDREGQLRVDPAHLEKVLFEDGFASVWVGSKGWYYLSPDGASLSVISFDNGPDQWSEGLARGKREGHLVYFNRQFEEATEHRFDWAWPFENGHALVCAGCVLEESNLEHRSLVGGIWWFIDHAGNEVAPEHLSEQEIARLERQSGRK